jgi:hypothetical protein
MAQLDLKLLAQHRRRSFGLMRGASVKSLRKAIEFVKQRGFVLFWPAAGLLLPSLWTAVAGDRPVPDNHDDPAHVTWRWKDGSLGTRVWYYAKVLRRRATMIGLEVAPFFYALSDNHGVFDEDHLLSYQAGRLPRAAMQIYDAILREGPLNTVDLRRAARVEGLRDTAFADALARLQATSSPADRGGRRRLALLTCL